MEARVGEGPVLCANRWRSLPQIPPVVTATRAHDGPGSSGSGSSARDAGNSGSAMSNTTARMRRAYGRAVAAAHRTAARPKVPGDAGLRRHPRRGARARLLAHGGVLERRGAGGGPRGALAALPPPRRLLRRPGRVRTLRGEPVRRRGGVPLPLVGPQPAGGPPRPGRHGRALPRRRRTSISTRSSCGPSTPVR